MGSSAAKGASTFPLQLDNNSYQPHKDLVMPALTLPDLYLCADGGGTSVTVAIASVNGVIARGSAGACNVKTVGFEAAINAILTATYQALSTLDSFLSSDFQHEPEDGSPPPPLPRILFKKVWLGLAGICYDSDIEAFAPFARAAFRLPCGDKDALRITSDGNLLAAPCTLLDVDSALALVAGTGTIGLSFRKDGHLMNCVGVTGGWGYLLGDEGSAFGVARLAIRSILHDDDARQTAALLNPVSQKHPAPLLPFYRDLLKHLGVSNCAALVDKTYSDHSISSNPTFHNAEANRKIWIAEATRLVFKYAFGEGVDEPSRLVARSIAAEGVKSLVDMAVKLVGDRSLIEPSRTALSLGGGLWKVRGYIDLLEEGLRERGMCFASVGVVGDPADEGVRALVSQSLVE